MVEPRQTQFVSGLTPRSLFAMLLALLLTAIMTQIAGVLMNFDAVSEYTLGVPAVSVLLALVVVTGVMASLTRMRLLNKAELLCVLYATLIASPLLTQGFWHRILAVTATIPRTADFQKMDALSDRVWPHGPNLLAGAWQSEAAATLQQIGAVSIDEGRTQPDQTVTLIKLGNTQVGESSAIRLRLPLKAEGRADLQRGEPYLASVLVRASDLSSDAVYVCRAYFDDTDQFIDLYRSNAARKVTFLQPEGFVRVGAYGVVFPPSIRESVTLEWTLQGMGTIELTDPKLFSVAALEYAFKGMRVVSEAEYQAIPEELRAGLIVKPDSYWSWRGLQYLLSGYIPLSHWRESAVVWTSFVLMILLACLAMAVLLRRQWMDNERYQMPVAKITVALLEQESNKLAWPEIFRQPIMWAGFVACLAWCLLKGFAFYNPKIVNTAIVIDMSQYFSDPGWGGMWNVRFTIQAMFLSMAIFMELNVLLSMVVGYLLYRMQYWIGEFTGWNVQNGYPWPMQQQIGAFVAYAVVVLALSWKYVASVLRQAISGKQESQDEVMSYRSACLLLLGCIVGMSVWAQWVGISQLGIMTLFGFILCVALVSMKIRTECGAPFGYFTPPNAMLLMTLLGGLSVFGSEAIVFTLIASFFLFPSVFFLIPGAQMEMIELGRRWNIRPRQIMLTCLLGVLGGIFLGGWVFLSNAYALGGETLRYAWAFQEKPWYFFPFNTELTTATNQMLGEAAGREVGGVAPSTLAFGFAFVVTAVLTVLRQIFSGLWFHPVGFMLGSTYMLDMWGSLLAAWAIRWTVLKIGGAQTVRTKLMPFFVGVFLAAVFSVLFWVVVGIVLKSQYGIETLYNVIP